MDAFEILVVILSITLAILLIASIFLVVVLVKLVNQLRVISKKAEEIVDDVESVSGFFRKSAGPVAITSLISNIVSKVTEMKGKKEK
jgi:hypothetical protein